MVIMLMMIDEVSKNCSILFADLKHSLKVGQKRKRLDRDSTTPSGDEHSVGSGGDPTLNGKKKKVRLNFTFFNS